MDDTQFHKKMDELYRQQVLAVTSNRSAYPDKESWKNRTRVSAKLDPETFSKLLAYCKANGFSYNTGLKHILSHYFQTHA